MPALRLALLASISLLCLTAAAEQDPAKPDPAKPAPVSTAAGSKMTTPPSTVSITTAEYERLRAVEQEWLTKPEAKKYQGPNPRGDVLLNPLLQRTKDHVARKEPPARGVPVEGPDGRDPTVIRSDAMALALRGATEKQKKALYWIDGEAALIVEKVLTREYSPHAVDVRHWHPHGILRFIRQFEAEFPHLDFWAFGYLDYYRERLKEYARKAGVQHDFGARPAEESWAELYVEEPRPVAGK